MNDLHLVPAYGRSYSDKETALAAWRDGHDFKIVRGPYCSVRDLDKIKADGWTRIFIHYWINDDMTAQTVAFVL